MFEEKIISEVKKFTINHSEKDDIHGYPHLKRVYNTCIQIGKKLDANLLILKIAALLHDIGRLKEKETSDNMNHAEISAEKALEFLRTNNFNLSDDDIDNVINCIKAHSFSLKLKPETLEAKILFDADKLDAIGAIGLYRTISFTTLNKGGIKQVIEHLERKIMKLKDRMHLESSKVIAESRHQIILDFYNKIKAEK